jgi:hypothetical protein
MSEREAIIKHLEPATTARSVWWAWVGEDDLPDWFDTVDDAVCYGIELALGQIRSGAHLRGGDDE